MTDLIWTFAFATSFTEMVSNWDTSSVTVWQEHSKHLVQCRFVKLEHGSVTDLNGHFSATSFTGDGVSRWNISSVNTFEDVPWHYFTHNCTKRSIYDSWNSQQSGVMDSDYSSWASLDCPRCDANEYVSNNACIACAAGTTNDAGDDASGSNTMCVTCAEDYYVSNNTCVACAAGTTNAAGDDYSGSDTTCVICAEDYYVSNNACVCPSGQSNLAGDDSSGQDTSCDTCRITTNQE